jgi:hypothetical protein
VSTKISLIYSSILGIYFQEMAYAKMTAFPGSNKPEIGDIFRHSISSDHQQHVPQATKEYNELLTTEAKLAKEDQNMVIII